ncbi:hypothetical protein Dimus_038580 [Dionaea muscipula]
MFVFMRIYFLSRMVCILLHRMVPMELFLCLSFLLMMWMIWTKQPLMQQPLMLLIWIICLFLMRVYCQLPHHWLLQSRPTVTSTLLFL